MADTTKSETVKAPAQAGEKAEEITKADLEKQAQEDLDKAKKNALDKDGNVKTNDEGLVIGLDGENPVSNTNPDPTAVRGTYVL